MTGREALKAAKSIREYCRSKNTECRGCIFNRKRIYASCTTCILHDPQCLPEAWLLEKEQEGMTKMEIVLLIALIFNIFCTGYWMEKNKEQET